MAAKLSVVLLHDQMLDKQGKIVCTSLTMLDVHDLARSAKTYGAQHLFIAHPAASLQRLAHTLRKHWLSGFGATYNPNRRDALEQVEIVASLDDAVACLEKRTGAAPVLIASSAKAGGARVSFSELRKTINSDERHYLLMLGTGWGMSDALLQRAQYFLEPLKGPTDYNHLSVRSACAIMLDRLAGV